MLKNNSDEKNCEITFFIISLSVLKRQNKAPKRVLFVLEAPPAV